MVGTERQGDAQAGREVGDGDQHRLAGSRSTRGDKAARPTAGSRSTDRDKSTCREQADVPVGSRSLPEHPSWHPLFSRLASPS